MVWHALPLEISWTFNSYESPNTFIHPGSVIRKVDSVDSVSKHVQKLLELILKHFRAKVALYHLRVQYPWCHCFLCLSVAVEKNHYPVDSAIHLSYNLPQYFWSSNVQFGQLMVEAICCRMN